MFADDAFNKFTRGGHGTLIGNWLEERSIRDATGEGRSVPQRHIPRSGLLKDFSKTPSCGPRKQDNTFERIYGPKRSAEAVPWSKILGSEELRETAPAPRELMASHARLQLGEQEVLEEEEERDRQAQLRYLRSTSEIHFSKPDETLVERPEHCRKSFKQELLHGPPPERSRALRNAGLEVQTNVHYANVEGPTHALMCMQDRRLRNDLRASACAGFATFGKQADFSKPVPDFVRGLCKDDEMDRLFAGLSGPRKPQGAVPQATQFQHVPALTQLKELLKEQWREKGGFVQLRQTLHDLSDHEGFVLLEDCVRVLAEPELEGPVRVFLRHHLTMRKDALRLSSLMASLRPQLPQQQLARALQTFQALATGDTFPLYAWLSKLRDLQLRQRLVQAFGGEPGDESSVSELPIHEHVFLDLVSDLAPFHDIDELLP